MSVFIPVPIAVTGPPGAPGTQYNWKGEWDSTTEYVLNDCIRHDKNGYISIQGGVDKNPSTEPTYWSMFVSSGYASGGLIKRTVLSAVGSGSFQTQPTTAYVIVRAWGGGGGGGGVYSTETDFGCAGAGGGAGGYTEKRMVASPNTGYNYTIGAGGSGGVGAVSGTSGGNTIFSGSTEILAYGGLGGDGQVQTEIGVKYSCPGAGAPIGYGGDIIAGGDPGCPGQMASQTAGISGKGGSALSGGGGDAKNAGGNGNSAKGNAGGGGGALLLTSGTQTGGDGGGGLLIIDEYSV